MLEKWPTPTAWLWSVVVGQPEAQARRPASPPRLSLRSPPTPSTLVSQLSEHYGGALDTTIEVYSMFKENTRLILRAMDVTGALISLINSMPPPVRSPLATAIGRIITRCADATREMNACARALAATLRKKEEGEEADAKCEAANAQYVAAMLHFEKACCLQNIMAAQLTATCHALTTVNASMLVQETEAEREEEVKKVAPLWEVLVMSSSVTAGRAGCFEMWREATADCTLEGMGEEQGVDKVLCAGGAGGAESGETAVQLRATWGRLVTGAAGAGGAVQEDELRRLDEALTERLQGMLEEIKP